ncbi:DUF6768 family protein [Croceitalea rosinachiae]|uniref:DUF6768 family protein n=1 Tax=Croceitalea rosinachiae TaxID=3075596 RepID=A0ABU3AF79_9FLAO|nr:DUF6768 family protein [Croceitalea sp. F388]MDT0608583.1 DUF6768 family protein [Croceitalea sp. F388]
MSKDLEKIDDLIKEALSKEEAKYYDDLKEQNLLGKIGEVYRGKLGWLAIIMNIVHLVFFGLFIYCIISFFNTTETNELIKWASGGFLCMIFMGMLKLYVWMQMDKNDILRELKRLELQVSVLNNK